MAELYVRQFKLMRKRDLPRVRSEGYAGEDFVVRVLALGPLSDEYVLDLAFEQIREHVGPEDVEDLYVLALDPGGISPRP